MELGRKTFSHSAQIRFASMSGDWNPIHIDFGAARRTEMGTCIAHGMNVVLWVLDLLSQRSVISISSIKCDFANPLFEGETAVAVIVAKTPDELRIRVSGGASTAIDIIVGLGSRTSMPRLCEPSQSIIPWPAAPAQKTLDELQDGQGVVQISGPETCVAEQYPHLCQSLSPRLVASLASISSLVGMVCPGLHSLLTSFTIQLTGEIGETALHYRVSKVERRLRIVQIAVGGPGIHGQVTAALRSPPVAQPSALEIAPRVHKESYSGSTVLVIGGSRGLGEVTSKICAAGGARVVLTYATGLCDAVRVCREIAEMGAAASVQRFDIFENISAQLKSIEVIPTHVYYYASCGMAARHHALVDAAQLAKLVRFNVTGFVELCAVLAGLGARHTVRVFYPSSMLVGEPPRGLKEYAASKLMGELACQSLQKASHLNVIYKRLPIAMTDQTSGLAADKTKAIEIVLPLVNEMQGSADLAGKEVA